VGPGVDERLRGDFLTVRERCATLERDRPGDVVVALERLGKLVLDLAVGRVADKTRVHCGENLAATGLGGRVGDQGVLGLAAVRGDDGGRVTGATSGTSLTAATGATREQQHPRSGDGNRPAKESWSSRHVSSFRYV
jgi:hypothetical protein